MNTYRMDRADVLDVMRGMAPSDAVTFDRELFGEAVFQSNNRFKMFMWMCDEGRLVDFCARDLVEQLGFANVRLDLVKLVRAGLIVVVDDPVVRRRLMDGKIRSCDRPDPRTRFFRVSNDPFWAQLAMIRLVVLDWRAVQARQTSMTKAVADLQAMVAEFEAERAAMNNTEPRGEDR